MASSNKSVTQKKRASKSVLTKSLAETKVREFSPAWVLLNYAKTEVHRIDLIQNLRKGVLKIEWKNFLQLIQSTEKEFESILPLSISGLQKNTIYNKATSERIYELAKLYGLGFEVFESKEHFKSWLNTPSRPLGGKIPFELLDSSFGFELVENEITRIQYNVYA